MAGGYTLAEPCHVRCMQTNGPADPDTPLDRLRVRLVMEPALWAPLADIADPAQFAAALMTLAGDFGLPVADDALQAALRPILPGADLMAEPRATDPPPSKDWLPIATFWWGRQLYVPGPGSVRGRCAIRSTATAHSAANSGHSTGFYASSRRSRPWVRG